MKQKTQKIILGILLACLIIPFASAEFWACFNNGDRINYCNNYKPAETCTDTNGCTWCMSVHETGTDCYVHGSWPKCNKVSPTCSGGIGGGGGGATDLTPPELIKNSPTENTIYKSRSVLFDLEMNEEGSLYYIDLTSTRVYENSLCRNCQTYDRTRNLKDGLNRIMIVAKDTSGNTAYKNVSFFVDSKAPRISKTEPRRGFADGKFSVEFTEDNPQQLTLYYGNKNVNVPLSSCITNRGRTTCNATVNLNEFNGNKISYYFLLKDIAGNNASSKPVEIDVDTSAPVINNLGSFWTKDATRRTINFNINITEKNLDRVSYNYVDSRGRLRERMLCSRLMNGLCVKKESFAIGDYDLTLVVKDKAGNVIGVPLSFTM